MHPKHPRLISPIAQADPVGPLFSRRAALTMGLMAGAALATRVRAQEPAAAADSDGIIRSHGYSYFGELKYGPDFPHFDYVNPDAPKGGEIAISASGTFDSLNPYSRKGRAAALTSVMYESLMDDGAPADEYGAMYGRLAEGLEYDVGKTWVVFFMRGEARFSDGTPVTAQDVVFSHNLFLEQGLPSYAQAVAKRVIGAEVIDDLTVKFIFAEDIPRRSLIDQVGSTPVFSKAWYEETGERLDESRMVTSPGSAPYMLDSFDVNRRVIYRRNPDYWGADLPVNLGRHNFDRIRIEYFADDTASFEAFKAGEYTFREEGNSKLWATAYDFPAAQRGLVMKEEIPDGAPPNNSGLVFNLGREQLKDKRVREAIALAYNFEWTNESLQYGLFKHRASFIQDTKLEAKGVPEGAELEMMKSFGDLMPAELLTSEPLMPHSSNAESLNDRRNLRKAMKLLDEAGWPVGPDGKRRNAEGELLSIDIPLNSSSPDVIESVLGTFVQNLQLMGIDAKLEKVDPSQYTNRDRDRDYDMIYDAYRTFLGTGTGLMQMYGSGEAAFSLFNPAGLASPLVDAVIQKSLETNSQDAQDISLRILDRVLRYEFFIVPTWYKADHWVAYWDMYDHPDPIPPFDLGYLDFWWYDDEKGQQLRASGALR